MLEAKGVLGRNVIYTCPVPLILPRKPLLLATFRGRILLYPDLCPDPMQLLSKWSSAREGWSAGMPSQTLGHTVLVKVAPECFWDNMEAVFTTLLKTMNNLQTCRGCFPQTSTKSLQCEVFHYMNEKLRAIFIASSPEPFCLPQRVFCGLFHLLTPKSDS